MSEPLDDTPEVDAERWEPSAALPVRPAAAYLALALACERAAALIDEGWCTGAEARAADGTTVFPVSPRAKFFCMTGALVRSVAEIRVGISWDPAITQALRSMHLAAVTREVRTLAGLTVSLPAFNDAPCQTPQSVVAALRGAARAARGKIGGSHALERNIEPLPADGLGRASTAGEGEAPAAA